jgi:hypothetical protein
MAHKRWLLDKKAYTRARTCICESSWAPIHIAKRSRSLFLSLSLTHTHTHIHTRAHTHTRARAHTHTHRNNPYLLLFHGYSCFVNASQCYVIRTLSVLFTFPQCVIINRLPSPSSVTTYVFTIHYCNLFRTMYKGCTG